MPDPIGYSATFNFAGYQAQNPTRPLPGLSLDVELANVSAAIASLIDAVVSVRRSDGRLANGVVGVDQIDSDLLARLNNIQAATFLDISPTTLATLQAAIAGVANDKLVTPLRTADAIAALRPYASQIQAQAGAATDVVMSPARTADYFNARVRAGQVSVQVAGGSLSAGTETSFTITVLGAVAGQPVFIGLPAVGLPANCILAYAAVTAADTVTVTIRNLDGGAATFTLQTYRAAVLV